MSNMITENTHTLLESTVNSSATRDIKQLSVSRISYVVTYICNHI